MRIGVWCMVVLSVVGCSRDLTLPDVERLTIELPFDSVAPRQRLTLRVRAPAGGDYTFAFASDGQRSGPSASLTAGGEYQAGERGLSQDVVRVTDVAGNTAEARISVGPQLAVTPPVALVAPGGTIQFTLSGGQPPYRFTLADGGLLPDDGTYLAPSASDFVETIVLSDATMDPLAQVRALVSVGNALVIYPRTLSVAPGEKIGFIGLGGQPPYAFSLAPDAGSSGRSSAAVDALTGQYQAGSNELSAQLVTDLVIVTDRNGQRAQAEVAVGLALRASLGGTTSPGQANPIRVTGGKPPYAFDFAPRGNRSAGAVDGRTGLYVAGPTPGGRDLLQVTDATGATTALDPVVVGPLRVTVPGGRIGSRLFVTNFDGDQRPDLLIHGSELIQLLDVGSDTQTLLRASPTISPSQFVTVPNASGRPRLVELSSSGVNLFDPLLGGVLAPGPTATNLGGTGDARATRVGRFVYRWATFATGCIGLERFDALNPSLEAECLVPSAADFFAVGAGALMASSDAYLFFLEPPAGPRTEATSSGPFSFRYFAGTPAAVSRSEQLALPPGYFMQSALNSPRLVDDPAEVGPERALVLLSALDGGAGAIWGVDARTPSAAFSPAPVPLALPAMGFAATPASIDGTLVAVWDDGLTVAVMGVGVDAGVTLRQRLDLAFVVNGASFLDFNEDGVKDLVTVDTSSGTLQLIAGEGDDTFGRRPRFAAAAGSGWHERADLDGDGATDLLLATGDEVQVLWGGAQERAQLAQGPRSRMGQLVYFPLVEALFGAQPRDLLFSTFSGVFVAPGSADGTFGVAQQVTSPDGSLTGAVFIEPRRANFGGGAPGPDLLTGVNTLAGAQFVGLFIRTGATTGVLKSVPLPGSGQCEVSLLDVDGGGIDDLLAACVIVGPNVRTELFLSRTQGAGASLTLGGWTPVTVPTTPPATTPLPGRPSFGRSEDGRSLGLWIKDDAFYVVSVATGSVTLTRRAVPENITSLSLWRLVPGSAEPELIVTPQGNRDLQVLAWNGNTYVERQRLFTGSLNPLGSLRGRPDGLEDLLVRGREGGLIVLTNDGTGTLR